MNRRLGRRKKTRLWAAMVLLLPLMSACGSTGGQNQKTDAIDAPPTEFEQTMLQESEGTQDAVNAADTADKAGTAGGIDTAGTPDSKDAAGTALPSDAEDSVTVYLRDRNGYLAPMTLRLAAGESSAGGSADAMAQTALNWLTQDPSRSEQIPSGFTAVVPEGMKADKIRLDTKTGTASVDFGAPLAGMTASQERKVIEALVWTMTELPGIDKVRLSVAGKPIRMLPSSELPVDEVLTRGFGINLEAANGVHMMRSMAVTLYFAARTDNGDGYLVPVTRLVKRNSDRMGAALSELIKGPGDNEALHPVLTSGITVEQHSQKDDTVQVSLHDEGWSRETAVPSEMMEALVMTMTETTGAPQVKVAMNGEDSFLDSDRRSYDRPVTRPVAVNVLKR